MFGLPSPFDKIVLYFVTVVVGVGLLLGVKYLYDESIRREAILEQNLKQLEEVVDSQRRFNENLNRLQEIHGDIVEQNRKKTEELDRRFGEIDSLINNFDVTESNKNASPLIKETIDALKKEVMK